jgi:hypothetical protein
VQTGATATGLTAGTYTVTLTDANGCTDTEQVTITQPAAALVAAIDAQTNVLCFGEATGSATASASGGTGAYTYSWDTSPVQTGATATGLTAGTYTVTLTDANGCTDTEQVTITQPAAPLNVSISSNSPVCENDALNLTSTPSGGTPGYSYNWTGPNGFSSTDQNPSITNAPTAATGTYTLIVTDANGCVTTATTDVTVNPLPTATISITESRVCELAPSPVITFTGLVGTAPYTFYYTINGGAIQTITSPGTNEATIDVPTDVPGTFTYELVNVEDANGCINAATGSASVIVVPLLIPNVTIGAVPGVNICEGTSVEFGANVSNAGANPTYEWFLNGVSTGITTATFTSSTLANADQISLQVTSDADYITWCPYTTTSNIITMTVNPSVIPTVSIVGPSSPVCPGSDATFSVDVELNGGFPTYQWQINGIDIPGATSSTFTANTLLDGDTRSDLKHIYREHSTGW